MDWWSTFLHPILQHSGISHSQQQRLPANVLIGWITGEKHIPSETFGSRGHCVPLTWRGLTSNCQYEKRGEDFPGQFLWVLYIGDGSDLHPPMWHVQLVGPPVQPCFDVLDRRLRWATPHCQCPGRVWASPGDVLSPAFGQTGEPCCYPGVY